MDAGIHLGCQLGNAPPIFFSVLPKRKRAVHGPKEKNAFGRNFAPLVQSCCTGGGVRWCLRVCEGFPTGAAGRGTGLMADSRGAGADKNRGARTHLNCSSFPVSRCGAPRISVTSVPLVPPSARSASLRAARVVVGVYAFGRMWASAPTLGLALLQGPTHRSAPTDGPGPASP